MEMLKIATAQFEHKSGDKEYNLQIIKQLSAKAANEGADVIAFHECCITGYSFALNFSYEEMLDLAEFIPDGPSVKRLGEIAREHDIIILAGLFEKDAEENCTKPMFARSRMGWSPSSGSFIHLSMRTLRQGTNMWFLIFWDGNAGS